MAAFRFHWMRSRYFIGVMVLFAMFFAVLFSAGCTGVGATTVARDRFDYVSAISDSWKRQALLNLVMLRYADAPVYVDIVSIINTYELQSQVHVGAAWGGTPPFGDMFDVGGSGRYTDRPTITYTPQSGERFTRSLMTPIPVPGILFLLQAGYPADYVFRICVQTINGHSNSYGSEMRGRDMDEGFLELITLMREVQRQGGLGMRIKPEGKDKKSAIVMFFRPTLPPAVAKKVLRIKTMLGINSTLNEIRVVYGTFATGDAEIAILSRSMLQIQINYASFIAVPESHVAEGSVMASPHKDMPVESRLQSLINVHSDSSRPANAHVAVRYQDYWYWIDRSDYHSKRLFSFLMFLFSLTEEGVQQKGPVVTVPTN